MYIMFDITTARSQKWVSAIAALLRNIIIIIIIRTVFMINSTHKHTRHLNARKDTNKVKYSDTENQQEKSYTLKATVNR